MSDYFPGRRSAGSFVLNLVDGKVRLECTIWQAWQPIVHSVIWCGRKQAFNITRRIGIAQSEKQSVEGAIEGSVGLTGVASIKSSVKGVLQQDVAWEAEVSSSQNFDFEAPKCGHLTAVILQLIRSYDFRYEDRRWLHRDAWSATVTEHTINLYDGSKKVEWDERCQCDAPGPGDYTGLLKMVIGSVSALVPYRGGSGDRFELDFGGRSVAVKLDPSEGFHGAVRREWLPRYFPFLLGRIEETYEATFAPYEETPIEVAIEVAARVSVASEFGAQSSYLER